MHFDMREKRKKKKRESSHVIQETSPKILLAVTPSTSSERLLGDMYEGKGKEKRGMGTVSVRQTGRKGDVFLQFMPGRSRDLGGGGGGGGEREGGRRNAPTYELLSNASSSFRRALIFCHLQRAPYVGEGGGRGGKKKGGEKKRTDKQ